MGHSLCRLASYSSRNGSSFEPKKKTKKKIGLLVNMRIRVEECKANSETWKNYEFVEQYKNADPSFQRASFEDLFEAAKPQEFTSGAYHADLPRLKITKAMYTDAVKANTEPLDKLNAVSPALLLDLLNKDEGKRFELFCEHSMLKDRTSCVYDTDIEGDFADPCKPAGFLSNKPPEYPTKTPLRWFKHSNWMMFNRYYTVRHNAIELAAKEADGNQLNELILDQLSNETPVETYWAFSSSSNVVANPAVLGYGLGWKEHSYYIKGTHWAAGSAFHSQGDYVTIASMDIPPSAEKRDDEINSAIQKRPCTTGMGKDALILPTTILRKHCTGATGVVISPLIYALPYSPQDYCKRHFEDIKKLTSDEHWIEGGPYYWVAIPTHVLEEAQAAAQATSVLDRVTCVKVFVENLHPTKDPANDDAAKAELIRIRSAIREKLEQAYPDIVFEENRRPINPYALSAAQIEEIIGGPAPVPAPAPDSAPEQMLYSETLVRIEPFQTGAIVTVRDPRKQGTVVYAKTYRTQATGDYECMLGLSSTYKCWKKMSAVASATLSVYNWIGTELTNIIVPIPANIHVYHVVENSHSTVNGNHTSIFIGNENATFPTSSDSYVVKTRCESGETGPCVSVTGELVGNADCVGCTHPNMCHADVAAVLGLVLHCAQNKIAATFHVGEGVSEVIKWFVAMAPDAAVDNFDFQSLALAQTYVQQFTYGVHLCLKRQNGTSYVCKAFNPNNLNDFEMPSRSDLLSGIPTQT